jgi:Flp pilus assembly protein TadG
MRRFVRRDRSRGQAMVEFAFAFPIFLLIVFGLIDLGRAVYVSNSLAEAARDGARYGSVQARAWNDARRDTVETWVLGRLTAVPGAVATVECTTANPGLGCTVKDIVTVTVETELDMITPIIGQIVGSLSLEGRSEAIVQN